MPPDQNHHDEVLHRLAHLRVDRASGDPAPHKPLLLLTVLELADRNELPDVLALSPELAFRFFTFFSVVAHRRRQRPDIRMPFHHLGGDGIWTPLSSDGLTSTNRAATSQGKLSPEFLRFVHDSGPRDEAKRLLIAKYFQPEERVALYTMLAMSIPSEDQIKMDAQIATGCDPGMAGREARFRLNVVAAYDYTCALTGCRLLTLDAGSLVDAAHIHQFADSRNNAADNGLALSKNAHWLFDAGLWTISGDYRVIIAHGHFAESSPDGRALLDYHGAPLRLPGKQEAYPNPAHLEWHRRNRFKGA